MSKTQNSEFTLALFAIAGLLGFLFGLGVLMWHLAHWITVWWFAGIYAGSALVSAVIRGIRDVARR